MLIVILTTSSSNRSTLELSKNADNIRSIGGGALNRNTSIFEITETLGVLSTIPDTNAMPEAGILLSKYPMITLESNKYSVPIRFGFFSTQFETLHIVRWKDAGRLQIVSINFAGVFDFRLFPSSCG
jgi:hypothetical protein